MIKKTYMQPKEAVKRKWHLVDARGQILGRLASQAAQKLVGKHKTTYTPHTDGGDCVVVINACLVEVTGGKEEKKLYYRHSGFPGGIKQQSLGTMMKTHPERVIEKAVYNMIPKNKLRSGRMNRLKVYAGSDHPHQSQFESKKNDK